MYYFASDIHLGAGDPETARRVERQFVAWLDGIESDAKALFLVGDIFDFWFEYGRVVPKGFVRVLGKLARMHDRGIRIVMFTGNHDMWVTDYLTKECGIEIFRKPQLLEIAGRRIFVAHGDNMNIKGRPMLRLMNALFRSRTAKFLFSWLVHPDIAVRFGHWWSGHSRKAHGEERDKKFLAPLVEYADEYAANHENVDCFVFGHMHIMADITSSRRILFMGDWAAAPNYLRLDDDGTITQITPDLS